jgi:hypothetical protein
MANEKLSALPVNNSPAPTDTILSVQNPASTPQDVQVPFNKLMLASYNPYKFSVWRNATYTTTSGSFVTMPFDTKVYDTGNNFSLTTSLFTVPITGFYVFNGLLGSTVGNSTQHWVLSLIKNTNEFYRGWENEVYITNGTQNVTMGFTSAPLQMSSGDTMGLIYYQSISNSVINLEINTNFSGYLMSVN